MLKNKKTKNKKKRKQNSIPSDHKKQFEKQQKTLPNIDCLLKQLYFTSSVSCPFCHFSVWHSLSLFLSLSPHSALTLLHTLLTALRAALQGRTRGMNNTRRNWTRSRRRRPSLKSIYPPLILLMPPTGTSVVCVCVTAVTVEYYCIVAFRGCMVVVQCKSCSL